MLTSDHWRTLPFRFDRRPIYEWAHEHVTMPAVIERQGKFDWQLSRHFMAPLDALQDDAVREVNILAPVRSGKTLMADIYVPSIVAREPSSILWVFQSDDMAKSHAETRAMPTLLSVPAIRPMLPADRHKQRSTEIIFANGLPLILTGPAVSNLQSRGFRIVILDEPWLYKGGIIGQAQARLGDFVKQDNSKMLCISQAGTEDCDWDRQFRTGEINEWHIKCLACGHAMLPRWTAHRPDGGRWGVVYESEKDKAGMYSKRQAIESMRFVCEACGRQHKDWKATQLAWNITGEYRCATERNQRQRSFHWTALIDYPWPELMGMWIDARNSARVGDLEPTIQFAQKRLAEPKSEATAIQQTREFARSATIETGEELTDKWARFVTVDKQQDGLYYATARAWSKENKGESKRLEFAKLYSESDIVQFVSKHKVASPTISIDGKHKVMIKGVFVDAGYEPNGDGGVYEMCHRNRWGSLKGTADRVYWHMERGLNGRVERVGRPFSEWKYKDCRAGKMGAGTEFCPFLMFSSDAIADRLDQLIQKGLWIEPLDKDGDLDREYSSQMAAEVRRLVKDKENPGREVWAWKQMRKDNHAWDCAKMQVLVAMNCKLIT